MNKFIAKRTLVCFYHTVFFTFKQNAQLSFAADDHPLFGLRHQLSRSLAGLARVCGLVPKQNSSVNGKALGGSGSVICVCIQTWPCGNGASLCPLS